DVVRHLRHRNRATWPIVLYDSEYLKPTWRITVCPDVHPIDDFARAAATLYDGIAAFPRLELGVCAADARSCNDQQEEDSLHHGFFVRYYLNTHSAPR